jgi:hypothetical protein
MRTIVQSVRTLVLISIFFFSFSTSEAQSISTGNGKIEIGLGLGPMFFLGDLGGNYGVGKTFLKDLNLPLTKFSKGLYLNIYPDEWIGFRIGINQGTLEGNDAIIKLKGGEEHFRQERNLEFRSNVWDVYGGLEIYPTVFFERYDGLKGKFRPYGVIGIGAFHFNPQARYYPTPGNNNNYIWVDLQPLRLEGQGMAEYPTRQQYSLTQMNIPMGIGFKYYIKDNLYIGMEVLHRKTFTDYIDNVSKDYIDPSLYGKYLTPEQTNEALQLYYRGDRVLNTTRTGPPTIGEQRGDPKQNDAYFSTVFKCGWRLNDWNSPNGRALRQLRCPAYY